MDKSFFAKVAISLLNDDGVTFQVICVGKNVPPLGGWLVGGAILPKNCFFNLGIFVKYDKNLTFWQYCISGISPFICMS